jgi:hypothetical protein
MKIGYLCCAALCLFAVPCAASAQVENPPPGGGWSVYESYKGCKLDLELQKKVPTKVPVTFACRIENQSENAWRIRNFSPFIMGYKFYLEVADGEGKTRRIHATNGMGLINVSAQYIPMKPGESKLVPLAIEPLPAGKYVLILEKKHSAHFEVVDDKALREKVLKGFVDDYWRGDVFGKHVLSKLPTEGDGGAAFRPVEEVMYVVLSSDDPLKAKLSLEFLHKHSQACQPELLEKAVIESIELQIKKNAKRPRGKWDPFFAAAARLAGKLGSDKALAAVMKILEDTDDNQMPVRSIAREGALYSLREFKQQAAADELFRVASHLLEKLADNEVAVRAAVRSLCARKDPRVVDVLLHLREHASFRDGSKMFYNLPGPFLNSGKDEFFARGTHDISDESVREAARAAERRLESSKGKNPGQ